MSLDSLLWKKSYFLEDSCWIFISLHSTANSCALGKWRASLILPAWYAVVKKSDETLFAFYSTKYLFSFRQTEVTVFWESKKFHPLSTAPLTHAKNKILLEVVLRHIDLAVNKRNNLFYIKSCQLRYLHEWVFISLKF